MQFNYPTWKSDRRAMFPPTVLKYCEVKEQHQDSIVLLKVGDFYEAMFEDAIIVSQVLELILTRKSAGLLTGTLPLAGIPYHALYRYKAYLVEADYNVHVEEM